MTVGVGLAAEMRKLNTLGAEDSVDVADAARIESAACR